GATLGVRRRPRARNDRDGPATGSRDRRAPGALHRRQRRAADRTSRSGSASPDGSARARRAALDVKALPATALILDVRVAELEALVQPFAGGVELGALQVGQAL